MTEVYGIEANSAGRLSFEDFLKVMKKMDIKISNTNVIKSESDFLIFT